MEPLIAAIKPYLSEGETYFFRPDQAAAHFQIPNAWESSEWRPLRKYVINPANGKFM